MTATILDGAAVARAMRQRTAAAVQALAGRGIVPRLEVILVGDDPASRVYVNAKAKASREAGIRSGTHPLPATTSGDELRSLIAVLNADDDVDAILLQLPLPPPLEGRAFLDLIDPAKDVDGFHPYNVGLLHQGRPLFAPCTPAGIIGLLEVSGLGAVVTITFRDAANAPLGAPFTRTLRAFEYLQVNNVLASAGVSGDVADATVELSVAGAGAVAAYLSVIDARTGDPITIMAER